MRERHVLSSALHSRKAWSAVAPHVEHEDFSEQGWIVFQGISDYYDADSQAMSVDCDILGDTIARGIAVDKHKDMFRRLVADLDNFQSSPANVVEDMLATKREGVGRRLAAALLAGENTELLLEEYRNLSTKTFLADEEEEEARIGMSVMELVEERFNEANLIQVMPAPLNARLDGGVKRGHHLLLYARPEMGKTLMAIEMVAGFAQQGLKVLYIGNEDPLDDVNMRIINRLTLMTKHQVMRDPERADRIARENGYENIILKGLAPGTPREITDLIEKYEPDVLVLDQLRNLNMGQENYVLKLEEAATQARTWAKKYSCVVLSITQAGDSATGKAVLEQGDVDFSNTGIPSTADLMIGLGANEHNSRNGEVVISLPKNKISGCHEWFALEVDPQLSKLNSLAE